MADDKNQNAPLHIAIIPDGNRRWAKEKGLPSVEGHRRGAENVQKLLQAGKELGIKAMTFWVFSTENWSRSKEEVNYLFDLLGDFLEKNREEFLKQGAKFIHLGRKDRIPEDLAKQLSDLEEETKDNNERFVGMALDYGGHDEVLRASQKLTESGLEYTEENLEKFLDTAEMPKPDLIIRTSGEQRLSGFMSWQNHYAELYFPEVNFPDFDGEELKKAVEAFSERERRFGGDGSSS